MSAPRTTYGSKAGPNGARIASVEPASPAADAGIAAGDQLLSAQGMPLRDAIDWQWIADGPSVRINLESPDGGVRDVQLQRQAGQTWGLEFETALFEPVRVCRNECTFCFMSQLPKGLRPSLYLRDDDYRLSFLHGNFVTLTNVHGDDVERIVEQHLSPLYMSLHAVDSLVRERLLCPRDGDVALEVAEILGSQGIDIHMQIVLVPGVNDGAILEHTLTWCLDRPWVASVGIVPVGRTQFAEPGASAFRSPQDSAHLLERIEPHLDRARASRGSGWLQLADEFYLASGRTVPSALEYGSFPQLENGIGMARRFSDVVAAACDRSTFSVSRGESQPVTLLSGELFAPTLAGLCDVHGPPDVEVLPVENRLLGGGVNVAGLLSGQDILGALSESPRAGRVVLPSVIFNDDGVTLDDMSLDDLNAQVDPSVTLVSCDPEDLPDVLIAPPVGT